MKHRIYTRTGDTGCTHLVGGASVSKENTRVEAYGDVDELNCAVGLAKCDCEDSELSALMNGIQNLLFQTGADLAAPSDVTSHSIIRISPSDITPLERAIDRLEEELPALNNFILPGGSALSARLHLARAICRRAERRCVLLQQKETMNPEVIRLLNRLSDLLFVMARVANHRAGITDRIWSSQNLNPET
jgi:cob(I)alamin adenosyltransferase